MSCMEISGGNGPAEHSFSVYGLDAWVISEPQGGQPRGGDIHYVSLCSLGRISRFAVADVAGHGTAADELAVQLRRMMRKYMHRLDQSEFARALNREFAVLADNGAFATALLMTYFSPTDQLIICNAGHPAPLWYRAGLGRWELVESDRIERARPHTNLPLGVIDPTQFHQFVIQLEPNDLVLVYTDALIEARDPDGEPLGEAGLLELVGSLEHSELEQFCRSVLRAVNGYRQTPSDDDQTLLLLHHNASNPPRPTASGVLKLLSKWLGLVKV